MNQKLFHQGEEASYVYIVVKGDIELIRTNKVTVEKYEKISEGPRDIKAMIGPKSSNSRSLMSQNNKNT